MEWWAWALVAVAAYGYIWVAYAMAHDSADWRWLLLTWAWPVLLVVLAVADSMGRRKEVDDEVAHERGDHDERGVPGCRRCDDLFPSSRPSVEVVDDS